MAPRRRAGQKTKDTSGNDQHGTLRNGTKWTAGKFGQALDLDGKNDYVEIADSPQLGGMKKITAAGWVFPPASAGYTGYIDKTRGGTAGWRSYNLAQRNGQWEWGLVNEANPKITLQASNRAEEMGPPSGHLRWKKDDILYGR